MRSMHTKHISVLASVILPLTYLTAHAHEITVFPVSDAYIQRDRTQSTGKLQTLSLGGAVNKSYPTRVLVQFDVSALRIEAIGYYSYADFGYGYNSSSKLDTKSQFRFSDKFKVDSAVLKLKCLSVEGNTNSNYGPGGSGGNYYHIAGSDVYGSPLSSPSSDQLTGIWVYASPVLKSWEEDSVTWRSRNAHLNWIKPYLNTDGIDAKYPQSSATTIHFSATDSQCQDLRIDVTAEVWDWLDDDSTGNYGLLLWPEGGRHGDEAGIGVTYGSRENGDEKLRPELTVLTSELSPSECPRRSPLKCRPIREETELCVDRGKICDFRKDCQDGEDEHDCGYACDFEQRCEGWIIGNATDGKAGFVLTSARRVNLVRGHSSDNRGRYGGGVTYPETDAGGQMSGHYLLFTAAHHAPGVSAAVTGPWYGSSGAQCMARFSANIYGQSVGPLHLYVHTGKSGIRREIWRQDVELGTRWRDMEVPVGEISEPFRLIYEAVRGRGNQGYIAIDNVTLHNCHKDGVVGPSCAYMEFRCQTGVCIPQHAVCDFKPDCLGGEDENRTLCATLPGNAVCTFESGLCGWSNYSIGSGPLGDEFWYRHQGHTPSDSTGPSYDHTHQSTEGHYLYMEANHMTDIGSKATVASPQYPAPPPQNYDITSPLYGACKLRFFRHMWGMHIQSLSVHILEIVPGCDRCGAAGALYFPSRGAGDGGGRRCRPCHTNHMYVWKERLYSNHGLDQWIPAVVTLPHIQYRYVILLEGWKNFGNTADIAVDDISLTPECFAAEKMVDARPVGLTSRTVQPEARVNTSSRYSFKSCGATGRKGPTQFECDAMYKTSEVQVVVLREKPFAGIQVWIVPKTTAYSITALGASGGTGVQNPDASKGAYAHAMFNFTEGEKIYLLIGQQGSSACSQTNKQKKRPKEICSQGFGDKNVIGGGGGGGGGTFVFKKVPNSTELISLIVAGGGGGKSFHLGGDPIRADGGLSTDPSGHGSATWRDGPGAGGGWRGYTSYNQSGQSLLEGALGGAPCPAAMTRVDWEISGGFGGGGGGCTAGGGGGGYSGGNVSRMDSMEHNGMGGASYIHPDGEKPRLEPGANHSPDGEVEIAYHVECPCEFMCIYKNYEVKEYVCYCSPNFVLAEDGIHCIDPRKIPKVRQPETLGTGAIIGIIAGTLVLFLAVMMYCGYCIVSQRHKAQQAVRLEQLSVPDFQLDRLRSANTATSMMTEYNPNYDFGDTKYTAQDLKEIPRDNLNLIRALGQGAFGEVYQGYLIGASTEVPDTPVAVKTLPALCTDQAEMDFLMEALIMSKFNHPNIVRFIGVCFEKHPRYIILELLVGGDIKSFLRESRPKPGQPSKVTMVDLVRLSLDVAKGCQYLEENHFIHRDIAARNCLLTTKSLPRTAKIADFGMARDIYRADYYRKGGKAMLPVKWMPPEAFLDGIFTSKTDVWSFGILLWEVFSMGYMPYPGRGNQEVMQLVTAGGRLEPPQNCPPPVYHLMDLCWHGIPERRPNFVTIIEKLQHCLQDPDVMHSPLPVFQRPPSSERDVTIVHPPTDDPSRMVALSVTHRDLPEIEPDTPNSTQPLIGARSPDYDLSVQDEMSDGRSQHPVNRGAIGNYSQTGGGNHGRTLPPAGGNIFSYDGAYGGNDTPPRIMGATASGGNNKHLLFSGNKNNNNENNSTKKKNVFPPPPPPPQRPSPQQRPSNKTAPGTNTQSQNNNNSNAGQTDSVDSHVSNAGDHVDTHVEDNLLNESIEDLCAGGGPPLDSDGFAISPVMNNSVDSGNSSANQSQLSGDGVLPNPADHQLQHAPSSSSKNIDAPCVHAPVKNNMAAPSSRSLSNSPWLSSRPTTEKSRPLYENMNLASHRSMSSIPWGTGAGHSGVSSSPLVNAIPESRSDPGDSGVIIDLK